MGYATSDSIVRVSVFKPSGKWIKDIALEMGQYYDYPILHDGIERAMSEQGYGNYVDNYICVCLEPYHQHSHPIMLKRFVKA